MILIDFRSFDFDQFLLLAPGLRRGGAEAPAQIVIPTLQSIAHVVLLLVAAEWPIQGLRRSMDANGHQRRPTTGRKGRASDRAQKKLEPNQKRYN